ncbi:unnamed protein product [Protopolystoma xenopodis]|uniref:Uncharacterized protein n=1 Tax=Protopolystoma xenopodis TaxID=117903 RepID=A0A448X9N4_9PLAT|nr:unnamed protein product [Protopolystoma xenopodis]
MRVVVQDILMADRYPMSDDEDEDADQLLGAPTNNASLNGQNFTEAVDPVSYREKDSGSSFVSNRRKGTSGRREAADDLPQDITGHLEGSPGKFVVRSDKGSRVDRLAGNFKAKANTDTMEDSLVQSSLSSFPEEEYYTVLFGNNNW